MDDAASQDSAFLSGEADAWYFRNKQSFSSAQENFGVDSIAKMLNPFKDEISRILEIGCSDGSKLRSLCSQLLSNGYGVDPSELAISTGSKSVNSLTKIELTVGTAKDLPYSDCFFDAVYFGFSLYLVDRANLLKSISEADRVLRPGGFLIIQDFDPGFRHKRPYSHLDGIYSFKSSYADLFTTSGHYYLIEKISLSHSRTFFDKNPDERISISMLYKEIDAYPQITN